ncbi:MAG: YlmC/YmxH family sporulation protein [Bacilli bacterium]|jgi:YlmC/YmxH family sporulation protein|nr:YlmC/YmxH family sporulation protein [Bacilli bacterium]
MRISDLQTKDVINQGDGRNIGRIIDMDINEDGSINYFIVEPKKIMKKLNIYNSETNINIKQIVKIGEDVILVDLR